MQVQLPILDKKDQPIFVDVKKLNVIYVNRDKQILFYRGSFFINEDNCMIKINKNMFMFNKKSICWRREPKRVKLKKYSDWEPYIFIMDSKAYEYMIP